MSPSFLSRLFGRSDDAGSGAGAPIAGAWFVVDISRPHPFGRYTLELRAGGVLEWASVMPTRDAGEIEVSGSGTWRVSGTTLHYTSGEHAGTLQFSVDAEQQLVLDGLPAARLPAGVRCVLKRAGS